MCDTMHHAIKMHNERPSRPTVKSWQVAIYNRQLAPCFKNMTPTSNRCRPVWSELKFSPAMSTIQHSFRTAFENINKTRQFFFYFSRVPSVKKSAVERISLEHGQYLVSTISASLPLQQHASLLSKILLWSQWRCGHRPCHRRSIPPFCEIRHECLTQKWYPGRCRITMSVYNPDN